MRKIVEIRKHESTFHISAIIRQDIQDKIAKELRYNFVMGKYGTPYCTECGRPLEFIIEKEDKSVTAVFICKPCSKEEKPKTFEFE